MEVEKAAGSWRLEVGRWDERGFDEVDDWEASESEPELELRGDGDRDGEVIFVACAVLWVEDVDSGVREGDGEEEARSTAGKSSASEEALE